MERTVSTASYVASGSAGLWGALTFNEWVGGAGLILASATFVVNLIYRERHYRLEKLKLEAATASEEQKT